MDTTALVLTIVGALNWALVGIFQFDLVAWIFGGQGALLSRIIYTVIGLAGIWCISLLFKDHPLDAGGGLNCPLQFSSPLFRQDFLLFCLFLPPFWCIVVHGKMEVL